jgi:Alkylmercury lyase
MPYGRALDAADIDLRNATYRRFVELGRAPNATEVAGVTGRSEAQVHEGWQRLHDAHALVLDHAGEIAMANPFAAKPTPFRVVAAGRSWFANCAWDAFGIAAAMSCDVSIATYCLDCGAAMVYGVRDGELTNRDGVVHFAVPAKQWWDDIGFT